jgi:hypothetical protein
MRTYSVTMKQTAVTTAITLIQIKAGASNVLRVLRAWVSQSNQTSSAQLSVAILRKTGAATVTSATPLLLDKGDAASGAVGGAAATGVNATVEGTNGDILVQASFSVLNGWLWVPVPEERIIVGPAGIIGLTLITAPGASMTTDAGIIFGEEGG